MKTMPAMIIASVGLAVCWTAWAENPAGLYVGVGAGYSTVRSDDPAYGLPGYYNDHQAAWKVMAGVRPISVAGAEFEYIDFGQPGSHSGHQSYNYYGFDSHPRATALFGVAYLPLPVPFFDVYGKAGIARLQTEVATAMAGTCPVSTQSCPPVYSRQNHGDNKLAYGMGLQSKLWGVSFRAEYERVSSQFGDPDAVTVGATWTF